ncbi:MAG: lytic transglycosylase domain-containing protein [Acidobacteriota bacterium]
MWPALPLLLAFLLGIPEVSDAGTVFFADGGGLTVEDAWKEGNVVFMKLPGGGILGTAASRVARVVLSPPATSTPLASEEKPEESLAGLIRSVAQRYQVQQELITAVVRMESDFDAHAVSRVGAMGLMQLMPETARDLAVADPFDPEQNLDGGVRYLKDMMERFPAHLDLALAAYNAGPAAVDRYGGIPPYPETMAYVKRVLELARR